MKPSRSIYTLLAMLLAITACFVSISALGQGTASAMPCTNCNPDPGGGGGGGTPALPKMALYSVSWSNFGGQTCSRTSSDQVVCGYTPPTLHGDSIDVTQSPGQAGYVTIVLRTASRVTWYKEIKAFDAYGHTLGWVSTSDSAHGPVSMTLPAANVAALVFTKAGFLGVHVGQYDLRGIASKGGSVETFDWNADN